jgi:HPt (histidine-containing phosphotransfer) domain-containing protein
MSLPPPLVQIKSPPLAPGDDAIDLEHLQRVTLGNLGLRREVLAMFVEQTTRLLAKLAARPREEEALAHTLKGSARAIGAFGVGDAAAVLEAAIRSGADPVFALGALRAAVADARASIEAILERP